MMEHPEDCDLGNFCPVCRKKDINDGNKYITDLQAENESLRKENEDAKIDRDMYHEELRESMVTVKELKDARNYEQRARFMQLKKLEKAEASLEKMKALGDEIGNEGGEMKKHPDTKRLDWLKNKAAIVAFDGSWLTGDGVLHGPPLPGGNTPRKVIDVAMRAEKRRWTDGKA